MPLAKPVFHHNLHLNFFCAISESVVENGDFQEGVSAEQLAEIESGKNWKLCCFVCIFVYFKDFSVLTSTARDSGSFLPPKIDDPNSPVLFNDGKILELCLLLWTHK